MRQLQQAERAASHASALRPRRVRARAEVLEALGGHGRRRRARPLRHGGGAQEDVVARHPSAVLLAERPRGGRPVRAREGAARSVRVAVADGGQPGPEQRAPVAGAAPRGDDAAARGLAAQPAGAADALGERPAPVLRGGGSRRGRLLGPRPQTQRAA